MFTLDIRLGFKNMAIGQRIVHGVQVYLSSDEFKASYDGDKRYCIYKMQQLPASKLLNCVVNSLNLQWLHQPISVGECEV